jgi:membrane protein DedA with SNARE-associated domain
MPLDRVGLPAHLDVPEPLIQPIEGFLFAFDLQMPDFTHHLLRLLQSYTYPVLVALVLLESLGIPLPGEIALVTAAAFASLGRTSIVIVVILGAASAIVGGIIGYWIGVKGGLPLVVRYGGYVGIKKSHIERTHSFFEKNGAKTILVGRFVAVLRTWAAVVAGAAAMSFTQFVVYTTIGSVVWSIVFGSLGFYFGKDLPLLEKYIARSSFAVLIVGAAGIGLYYFLKRRKSKLAAGLESEVP